MKESISNNNKSNRKDNLQVALSCVAFLIIWEVIALVIKNDIYLPTIGQTLNSLKEIIIEKRFYIDVLLTVMRTSISFLVAFIVALILGLLSYSFRIVRNFLKPLNALVQSIPNMVLIVLALIWFNKDNTPYIVGFAVVFPILYEFNFSNYRIFDSFFEAFKYSKSIEKEKIILIENDLPNIYLN